MAWHKAQNDQWAWDVFQVTTGPDTGTYIIASGNHQWAEMERWDAKMGDADTADSRRAMGGFIEDRSGRTGRSSTGQPAACAQ